MTVYATALRKFVLPRLLQRDNRGSALSHWRQYEQSQFWTRQQLLDYQWQQLTALLDHAYSTTRYYRKVFDECGLTPKSFRSFEDLAQLPMLTREHIYGHLDDLLSDCYDRDELIKFTSGGTTGQRAVMYRDQESHNMKLGLSWRHESWIGREPGEKMALVWPANMDFVGELDWKEGFKQRYLWRQLMFQAGSEREEDLRATIDSLNSFRPNYLKAFPSALQRVARYSEETGVSVRPVRSILATGEPLYPAQLKLFERVFGARVFDMYGSRETGNTACQCPEADALHIAMETNLVEFVDNGRSVRPGQEGEMLITDLTNYARPMLRYQINDHGIPLTETCSCGRGSLMMSNAIGRLTDDIYSPDGTRHSGHVLGYALAESGPMIGQIQVIQNSLADFQVRVTNKPVPTQDDFDYITGVFRKLLGDKAQVRFEVLESIPKEKSGKTRFVKCLLDKETRARLNTPRRDGVENPGYR